MSLVYVCKVRVTGKVPWSEEEGERGRPSWNPKGLEKARQGEPVKESLSPHWLEPHLTEAALSSPVAPHSSQAQADADPMCCCAYDKLTHTSTAHTQTHKHLSSYAFYRGHEPLPWMGRSCLGRDWVPGTQQVSNKHWLN